MKKAPEAGEGPGKNGGKPAGTQGTGTEGLLAQPEERPSTNKTLPGDKSAEEKGPPRLLRDDQGRGGPLAADLVQKAMLKLDAGDWKGAIAILTEAIGLDPADHTAWLGRAMAHSMAGKYREAEADAKKAIELAPTDARAWTTLAWAQFKQGKFASALSSAQKAIALDAKSALFVAA